MKKNKFRIISSAIILFAFLACFQLDKHVNAETNNRYLSQYSTPSTIGIKKKLAHIASIYKKIDESKNKLDKCYNYYFGSINGTPIRVALFPRKKNIEGTYFYKKYEKEIKLVGKADKKKIILYEYGKKNKKTGIFYGTIKSKDTIEGTWLSASGKNSYHFALNMEYLGSEVYGRKYGDATDKSDKTVEKFVKNVRKYITNKNKKQLSKLVSYPIKAKLHGKTKYIKNSSEFIKNYKLIFNKKYYKVMSKAYTKYMYTNYSGICFGGDMYNMWINEVILKKGHNKLMITAMNN